MVPGAGLGPASTVSKALRLSRLDDPGSQSRLPGSNGSSTAYRAVALPDELRRHGVLGAIRTHTAVVLSDVPPAVGLRGHESRHPVPPRITRLTGTRSQLCVTAKLPAVDSNHDRRAQNAASYQLDERALVRAARFAAHWTGFEPAVWCHWATPACAARGSNSVPWIKGPVHHPSCLRRSERIAGIEPAFSAWRAAALPLSYIRVVPAGTEPASAGFQPAANPSQLENHGREAGTRTPSAWSQARRANPYATSRRWRCPESNRVGNACRARPLTSATHPQEPGGWRLPAMLTLWSCQLACTFAPQGGAPHGRKDSNPDQAGWSRSCLPLHHAHMCSVMQTARQGDFPAGGFLVSASASTREPPRWYRASRTAGWRRASPDSASLRTCVP
jgi:hypothetical protein